MSSLQTVNTFRFLDLAVTIPCTGLNRHWQYFPGTGKCYRVEHRRRNYQGAVNRCRSYEAALVEPTNRVAFDFTRKLCSKWEGA